LASIADLAFAKKSETIVRNFAMTKGEQSDRSPNRPAPNIRAATGHNAERGRFEEAAKAADGKVTMAKKPTDKRPSKPAPDRPQDKR
jgi:hypothetical protein